MPVPIRPSPIREVVAKELEEIAGRAGEQLEPAVIRGLASNFPVVQAAISGDRQLLLYLQKIALPFEVEALHAPEPVQGKFGYNDDLKSFNFTRITTSFRDFVMNLIDPGPPAGAIAVQGIRASDAAPGFSERNVIAGAPAGGDYRLWLGTQAEVAIHCDPAPNIAYVAGGRRRFTLFAPEEIGNLYMGPFDPVPNGTQISLADPLRPDDSRFPLLREALARSQFAELCPGDAIFIPTGWYHHVEALAPINLLINYWWQQPVPGPSPWDALMHGFMALRDLPSADRRVWRAMFAHYIFEDNGDPGAHIQPDRRGIIARPTPAMKEAMRRRIIRALAGPQ